MPKRVRKPGTQKRVTVSAGVPNESSEDDVPLLSRKRSLRSDQLDWQAMLNHCIKCGHPITTDDIVEGYAALCGQWKVCTDHDACAEYAKQTNFTPVVRVLETLGRSDQVGAASTSQDASLETERAASTDVEAGVTTLSGPTALDGEGHAAAPAIASGQQDACQDATVGLVNSGSTVSATGGQRHVTGPRTDAICVATPGHIDLTQLVAGAKEDMAEMNEKKKVIEQEFSVLMDNGVRVNPNLKGIKPQGQRDDEHCRTSSDDEEEGMRSAQVLQRLSEEVRPPVNVQGAVCK